MKPIRFGSKKGFLIQDPEMMAGVSARLERAVGSSATAKVYSLLNDKTLPELTKREYYVSLNTLGQKYLLYLTLFEEDKRYCIFISRKKGQMIITRFQFTDDLFEGDGTLIEGDLIKLEGERDQWVFLATDILLDAGKVIKNLPLKGRIRRLTDILTNKHIPSPENDCYRLTQTKYFENKYIRSLLTDLRPTLDYGPTVTGLYFKAVDGCGKDILYILPECRNTTATVVPRNTSAPASPARTASPRVPPPTGGAPVIPGLIFEAPIAKPIKFKESDRTQTPQAPVKVQAQTQTQAQTQAQETVKISAPKSASPVVIKKIKKTGTTTNSCCFRLAETELPDVYELYGKDGKAHGHAAIPDIKTSQLVSGFLDTASDPRKLFVRCSYLTQFDKWVPVEICTEAELI